jgi:hypothetical protein
MPALAARRRTFGEEAIVARLGVLAQEPAIAKVVVALDQLDAVPAPQTELVGAAGQELVCGTSAVLHGRLHHRCARTDDDELVAGLALLSVGSLHGRDGRNVVQRRRVGAGSRAVGAGSSGSCPGHCKEQRWFMSSRLVEVGAMVEAGAKKDADL